MNHEHENEYSNESTGFENTDDNLDIPELTQQIPVVDQIIPELTQRADTAQKAESDYSEQLIIPELTETYQATEHTDSEVNAYPVMMSQISDQELELQQWQIEQQAESQASEWQQVATMDSTPAESSPEIQSDTITKTVNLSDEQQTLVDASWQKLEALIMEQMPIELAGIYLTMLEQQHHANRAQIAEAISLLESETLENILDYFQIESGF